MSKRVKKKARQCPKKCPAPSGKGKPGKLTVTTNSSTSKVIRQKNRSDASRIAEQLRTVFPGRDDVFFEMTDGRCRVWKQGITSQDLVDHIKGTRSLAFYPLRNRMYCRVTCVDLDASTEPEWKERALTIHSWLKDHGIVPSLEVSQSGEGAHIWIFFEKDTNARIVKSLWRLVSEKTSIKFREVFPKQDKVSGKGFGNAIRYPLFNKSCFVDVAFRPIDPSRALMIHCSNVQAHCRQRNSFCQSFPWVWPADSSDTGASGAGPLEPPGTNKNKRTNTTVI